MSSVLPQRPDTTAVVVTCGVTPYLRRTLEGIAAQTHALDFYLRHGFEAVGEVFMEAGIPHRAMRRTV